MPISKEVYNDVFVKIYAELVKDTIHRSGFVRGTTADKMNQLKKAADIAEMATQIIRNKLEI